MAQAQRVRQIPWPGWGLVLLSVALMLFGLVILSSASHSFSRDSNIFYKQGVWAGVALCAGILVALVPLDWLRRYSSLAYLAVCASLVLVLIPGVGLEINGARRWLPLGPANVQASEFMKFFLVLLLAHYLASHQRDMSRWTRGFVWPMIIIALPTGLIFLQPDFGTAFLCGLVGVTMLFLSGVRLRFVIPSVLMALIGFGVAVYQDPVRLRRITSFLDVEGNKTDSAFQLWQGMLAFGVGGLQGVGLGNGRQQMYYIPEAHTDFIYSIVGEELGLWMTFLVLFSFLLLFLFSMVVMKRTTNRYHFILCVGAVAFVVYQALINMGVVTGCLPTKGMSLPFVSYGGSNLVVVAMFVGLIINVLRSGLTPLQHRAKTFTV